MSERELFWEWAKKENPKLIDEAETGCQFAKDILDYMFMGWVGSANREGYKLVPVDATKDIVKKLESMASSQPAYDGEDIYKVAIGEADYYWKTGVKPMIGAVE